MRTSIRFAAVTCLLISSLLLTSCLGGGGGGGGNNNDTQQLKLSRISLSPDDIEVNLAGPTSGASLAVTYFIFGSHVNLGDETEVPLFPDRMDEQTVATLAAGETLLDVDLSPWSEYEYVYLRAIPCVPQIIILLKKGDRYDFSST